jgi:hypothetical protein
MEMKKLLVIGIIFLFIGVAVAPSINFNIVKASNDNDLVEVTSQACGIKGFGNTTVKLTKQQYQDLEQYLVDFRARLNQTTTRDEAVPIFKEAVVELNKHGLLPKRMNVELTQRLVTIGYRMQNVPKIVKKSLQISINYDCLFTAVFYDSGEYNIWVRIAEWFSQFVGGYYFSPGLLLLFIFFLIGYLKPLRFNNEIDVLGHVVSFFSIGLGGVKFGQYYIGKVLGFTGLKIILNNHDSFYLGYAVDIQERW